MAVHRCRMCRLRGSGGGKVVRCVEKHRPDIISLAREVRGSSHQTFFLEASEPKPPGSAEMRFNASRSSSSNAWSTSISRLRTQSFEAVFAPFDSERLGRAPMTPGRRAVAEGWVTGAGEPMRGNRSGSGSILSRTQPCREDHKTGSRRECTLAEGKGGLRRAKKMSRGHFQLQVSHCC
jgi:hypothetical protein